MAGTHPFLTKLRGVVKTLDDDALAGLANKGLLRRAQKDLESARPRIVAVDDGKVRVQLADASVDVPELVARSTCTCPATGICRHILGALLFLRDDPELAAADALVQKTLELGEDQDSTATVRAALPPSPADVLGNLSDEELQKWAGKGLFRKALKALAASPQVEIESAAALVVRFPSRNITCRWIPSGGLLGMVCSCQAETVCEHVVTAVLAYQTSLGKRQVVAETAILEESAGAPRTRAEVLASVGNVLREMISLGLARVSEATVQRLVTLAVSAHGVDLPRLERMLKSLADELNLMLRRDAQASSSNLLALAARIEALRTALVRNPAPALVGQHRSQYHDVGQITLIGLGAQQWRSPAGYQGVTVYFWDESRKGWSTWSESRPVDQPGFSPAGRFFGDGPWAGCASPPQAARSVLRLSGTWRNPQGRISGRAATRAIVTGPSQPAEVPGAITKWSQLAERARQLFGGRLGDRTENLELALLVPKMWGPAFYDSLRQELVRPVLDEEGRAINLWLPFTAQNETAIKILERHDPTNTFGLLGALRLVAGRICVQPISLFAGEEIVSLNLEQSSTSAGHSRSDKASGGAKELEDEEVVTGDGAETTVESGSATPLGRFLITAQAEVEALAESGIAVRHDPELLTSAARRLDALGLTSCAVPVQRLLQALSRPARLMEPDARDAASGALLHVSYVLRLAADHETVAAACTGLG
jgi:SWIM zinc finger